ncbi:MAG: metalloprotease PmbA [Rhodocyclaceae bacterium]
MSDSGFTFSQDRLREIAAEILDYARLRGAAACETDVSEGFGQSVTVRKGEVETIEYNRDKGIGVTIYLGHQRGYASSSDFSRDALRATVDAAISIARFTAPDPCAGLPEEGLLAKQYEEPKLYFPWPLSVAQAISVAKRCEAAAFAVSPMVTNSEGATVSTQESHFVCANSLGFSGGYPTSRHYISCAVIVGEGDNMQRDDWYSTRRDGADLASPDAIGDYAARRALARLGARKMGTAKIPVLFEAPLAATLLGNFVHAASGGALYRKSSFLAGSLGKPLFSDTIEIQERPHLPKGLATSPFDDDGVATQDRNVVTDGILEGYFLSTYSARKLGMQTTGNSGGCHNLIVKPGRRDFRGMLKEMGRGLLVTELLGHGVNYVTGDYSRGAAGFWVENGEIQYPVHEITIAGNLSDMFRDIVEVGSDVLVRGSKHCGSILVEQMTVAGS